MQEKTISYKKTNISFTDIGRGNVVVLLHGFLENNTMWDAITPTLIINKRVISIDLLGHGKTGNLGYIHSMEEQAKMVKHILTKLKLRRYSLVGHSLGGYVVLAFVELYPENVRKFVLLNSTSLPDSLIKQKNRDRAISIVKKNKNTFIKMAIPNLFTIESREKHKNQIDFIKKEALKTTTQGVIASLEGMKIRKERSFILNNSIKNLFIIGRKDPLLDYNSLITQTENTNTITKELSTGHMSHVEDTKAVISTLVYFLK